MRRAVILSALLFVALPASAAKVTVGTVSGAAAGGVAAVPISFAAQGTAVGSFSVDIAVADPLAYVSLSTSISATAAGKTAVASSIAGGVRVTLLGTSASMVPDGTVATLTLAVAPGAVVGTYPLTATNPLASDVNNLPTSITAASGAVTVVGGAPAGTWIVPSTAHVGGANGAVWTTDLVLANTGTTDAMLTLKFLGHDAAGTNGPQYALALLAGRTTVVSDVLATFGVTNGWGAVQVASTVPSIAVSAQTSTPGVSCNGAAAGTFGQSVPAVSSSAFVANGAPRSIAGVREDGSFHTNLVLANGTSAACDVDVALVLGNGTTAATKRFTLPALGMTQATNVVRVLGVSSDVSGARLVLSPVTSGGAVAAYASVIDNASNDPRTLLPQ